ncbi:hypothetical protein BX600DRAFT_113560 [Xylariales sp. PMI_506]|nr:hypothetical protein BX600DRAFT_113560 [Xylariales sp. PMI_506]
MANIHSHCIVSQGRNSPKPSHYFQNSDQYDTSCNETNAKSCCSIVFRSCRGSYCTLYMLMRLESDEHCSLHERDTRAMHGGHVGQRMKQSPKTTHHCIPRIALIQCEAIREQDRGDRPGILTNLKIYHSISHPFLDIDAFPGLARPNLSSPLFSLFVNRAP